MSQGHPSLLSSHWKSVISCVHTKAVSKHTGVAYSLSTFVNNEPGLKYQILKTLTHSHISQGRGTLCAWGTAGRKFSYTQLNRWTIFLLKSVGIRGMECHMVWNSNTFHSSQNEICTETLHRIWKWRLSKPQPPKGNGICMYLQQPHRLANKKQ